MKREISKNLKIILLGILVFLLLIISFLLFRELRHSSFTESKKVLYNYKTETNIEYEVNFKPNILYDTPTLGEGNVYITEYVDDINATFIFEFNGERTSEIKGDYEIIGIMEGFTGEGEKYKKLWTKNYVFLPKVEFDSQDQQIAFNEKVTIHLDTYEDFIEVFKKETKVMSQARLALFMNINLVVNTDEGLIEKKFSPNIAFPLDVGYFQITKSQIGENLEAIEEIIRIQLPINKKMVIIYAIMLVIILTLLLCLVFLTVGIAKDEFIRELNKIFKKHGSRLVALNNNEAELNKLTFTVKTIEDLVRVADEIGKPIMYKYSTEPGDITEFYIFADQGVYIFDLKSYLFNAEKEKTIKKVREKLEKKEEVQKEIIKG